MAIVINGSGTLTGVSVGGLPDGIVDTDMLATSAVTVPKIGYNGAILQVVENSTSTEVVVNTTTYTDSGLSASITPTSNTSKILVLINQEIFIGRSASTTYAGIRVYRDSTLIHDSATDSTGPYDYAISAGGATSIALYTRAAFSILDSPGSTSSLTYKTQGRPYYTTSGGNITFNGSASAVNATSYIILLEVAA